MAQLREGPDVDELLPVGPLSRAGDRLRRGRCGVVPNAAHASVAAVAAANGLEPTGALDRELDLHRELEVLELAVEHSEVRAMQAGAPVGPLPDHGGGQGPPGSSLRHSDLTIGADAFRSE